MATAGLKGIYQIARQAYLPADAGIGDNALHDRLQISAAFAGGGDSFVTSGHSLSPWLYSAGLGLVATRGNNVDLSVRYGVPSFPVRLSAARRRRRSQGEDLNAKAGRSLDASAV